jgi:hypothetical protein
VRDWCECEGERGGDGKGEAAEISYHRWVFPQPTPCERRIAARRYG